MKNTILSSSTFLMLLFAQTTLAVSPPSVPLTAKQEASIAQILKEIQILAQSNVIVKAVVNRNKEMPPEYVNLTNDAWKRLPVIAPIIKDIIANEVSAFLRSKRTIQISEMFVSAADGTKVAFLEKTTRWNHSGREKHDVPMTGKNWKGPAEFDESSGTNQIQLAVPIISGDKPIGSLVVGVAVARL